MIQSFHFSKLRVYHGPPAAYGYLTLQAPSSGMTELILDFTMVDNDDHEVAGHLKRYIATMKPGERRTFGFHLISLEDTQLGSCRAKVSLSWSGSDQETVSFGDYEQPLRAIRGSDTLNPQLRNPLQLCEKKLLQIADEVRQQRGVEVDYWSHTLGDKLGAERYSLGLEVPLPRNAQGFPARSGIRIDLGSTSDNPKVLAAGITWDGAVHEPWNPATFDGAPSPTVSVEQIEGLIPSLPGTISTGYTSFRFDGISVIRVWW